MRLASGTMRVFLAIALVAIFPSGRTAAQPTPSSEPTDPVISTPPSLATDPAPPQPLPSTSMPEPVANMAYASNNQYLFIQGGKGQDGAPNYEYYFLNLLSSWDASSPAWKNLGQFISPSIPFSGRAGVFTQDGFMVTDLTGALYIYRIKNFEPIKITTNLTAQGPVIAANPNTSDVFFMGEGEGLHLHSNTSAEDPSKPTLPTVAPGHAVAWSSFMNAVLGTFIPSGKGTIDVQTYTSGTTKWAPLSTTNSTTSPRTGHCFVPNLDGSKFYLFGGVPDNGDAASSELFMLDVETNSWTALRSAPSPRSRMACAVAQDMLVVWGGYIDAKNITLSDSVPMLFDLKNRIWVGHFKGSDSSEEPPGPSGSPGALPGLKTSGSSHVGVIAGTVGGGVVLIALLVGLLIYRRKGRHARNKGGFPPPVGAKASESHHGTMEMGGYTTIPSPFVPDDNYYQHQGSSQATSPDPSPVTRNSPPQQQPMENIARSYKQPITEPLTSGRITFSPPPLKPRPQLQQSQAPGTAPPLIQSPFESDTDAVTQPPIIPAPAIAHRSGLPPSVQSQTDPYHDRHMGQQADHDHEQSVILSRTIEPTTVDLIPISELGDGSQASRSNSLVSSRSASRAAPSRAKSKHRGQTSNEGPSGELESNRRDSTESLEYLEIS